MAYHEIEKESFLHKDGEERVFFADKDARRRITDLEQGGGGGGGGAVTSVNGKTGAVNLSASDVHALPDSTVIPTVPQMATNPNMSDWDDNKTVDAFTLKIAFNAGFSSVTGLINAKANASDIPTKTSDLTNDSGYQTAQQVQTAIAPLQPKSITDTGGYYTTDTVEGALQEIGAELGGKADNVAVTASDNGKFMRVVNGAWAAVAVPSAESNSFGGGS